MNPLPSQNTATVEINKLNFFYNDGNEKKQFLFDISLNLDAGEVVILTGPSGSGKTTLLSLIGGLRTGHLGRLNIFNSDVNRMNEFQLMHLRRNIGFIFQSHNLIPYLNATENVDMGLRLNQQWSKQSRTIRHRCCQKVLTRLGMDKRLTHMPGQLSGGQKQRVAIARAIAQEPLLILADEPTASLDAQSGQEVCSLFQEQAQENQATVIIVTHDERLLRSAQKIIYLDNGRIEKIDQHET